MSAPVVRPATVGDAAACARIQVRAWHTAFADLIFPELTPTVADQTERWTAALADPEVDALVAELRDTVHGFVAWGPARDADAGKAGEIYALFVDPVAQGAGVGGLLMREAEGALRFAGYDGVVLWTPEEGLARGMYEGRGYTVDRAPEPGHGVLELSEVRYRGAPPD